MLLLGGRGGDRIKGNKYVAPHCIPCRERFKQVYVNKQDLYVKKTPIFYCQVWIFGAVSIAGRCILAHQPLQGQIINVWLLIVCLMCG